ncbi:MAG: response regulator [Gammaproteobacteria bacterium]|nr:MAG: response regulator [Gammaproteobacteria bacterium]
MAKAHALAEGQPISAETPDEAPSPAPEHEAAAPAESMEEKVPETETSDGAPSPVPEHEAAAPAESMEERIVEAQTSDGAPPPVPEHEAAATAESMEEKVVEAQTPGEEALPPLDLEPELAAIFLEEASELVDKNENAIQAWRQAPEESPWVEELQRNLHTLKGSARMAGIMPIGDLSHAIESLVVAAREGRVPLSDDFFRLLQEGNDRLAAMVETVGRGYMPSRAEDVEERIEAMLHPEREVEQPVMAETAPAAESEPLTAAFLDTAPALLQTLMERVHAWKEDQDAQHLESIRDTLHALRSGAQASGFNAIAELAETLLSLPPENYLQALDKGLQALASMIAQAKEGKPVTPDPSVMDFLQHLKQPPPVPEKEEAVPRGQPRYEQVRVRADLLDKLINYAAEINIYHSRMEQQMHAFHYAIEEMDQTRTRLGEQIRRLYLETEAQMLFHHREEDVTRDDALFDPLELDRYTRVQQLSRALAESVNDLENIENLLNTLTKDSEMLLVQEGRVENELQEGLMRARMLPFAVLIPRLRRTLRQICAELGKQAELHIEGGDIELDRAVLDKMAAPLEHMLRNAVDHGIEPPEVRRERGKPPTGTITLHLERKGTEVILQVTDDGAGIDVEAVRQKAIEKGLMKPEIPLSDQDILPFIMEPGFTTSGRVSMVSGRGVGMDVVDSTVKQLGGTVHITTQRGQGTTITIRLPLMLSIAQALVVRVREEVYAIPLTHIRAVKKIKQDALMELYGQQAPEIEHAGERYPLLHLGTLLEAGPPQSQEGLAKVPLLLVHIGDLQAALHIEDIVERQEIVIKPLGVPLNRIRGLLGATILPDGGVALILDTATVLRRAAARRHVPTPVPARPAVEKPGRITVMVVDDSITMRKVAARLLERHGMEVITAKDGVDALEKLQQQKPDLILLDIEMPRMDGYELARHIRHDQELADIPIIMVTSRIGEKHRKYAESIGVDKYIGKPYQETELIESIQSAVSH